MSDSSRSSVASDHVEIHSDEETRNGFADVTSPPGGVRLRPHGHGHNSFPVPPFQSVNAGKSSDNFFVYICTGIIGRVEYINMNTATFI